MRAEGDHLPLALPSWHRRLPDLCASSVATGLLPADRERAGFGLTESSRKPLNDNEQPPSSPRPRKMHVFNPETHAAIL
jgi:hypothetical protein